MKIIRLILYGCLTSLVTQCDSTQRKEEMAQKVNTVVVIDIMKIAGKSASDVEKILGKPSSVDKVKPGRTPCETKGCKKATYQDGKFEIVYINDVADWITIDDVSSVTLDESAITTLSLINVKPSFSNPPVVIRWSNVNGIKEISFFNNGQNKVEYIYIKVKTD